MKLIIDNQEKNQKAIDSIRSDWEAKGLRLGSKRP